MTSTSTDKATFTAEIEERVRGVLKEFQTLELAQMRKGEIEARAKLANAKEVVDAKRSQMRQSLKRARKASGAAWDDARAGMESAWDELSQAVEKAREDFQGARDAEKDSD